MNLIDDLISVFPSREREDIKLLIEKNQEFKIYPNQPQIWASILILSGASFKEVIEILPHAKKDWRDVVVAAGLAIDDWKQVAENWLQKKQEVGDKENELTSQINGIDHAKSI